MYFLPRTNKLYSWLAHQKISHLYLMTLVTGTLLATVWFVFVYSPLQTVVDASSIQLQQVKHHKQELQIVESVCKKLEKNILELEHNIHVAQEQSAAKNDDLQAILGAAHHCKLSLKNCARESSSDGSWYTQQPFTLNLQGTIEETAHFFKELSKAVPLITVPRLSFQLETSGLYLVQVSAGVISVKNI
jgi:Tfp pilus assembly protein PilO